MIATACKTHFEQVRCSPSVSWGKLPQIPTFPAFSTLADYATTDQSVTIGDRAGFIAAKTVCIPALCC